MSLIIAVLIGLLFVAAALWWQMRIRLVVGEERQHRELTELRAAHEAALAAHRERFRAVLDSMVEGILVLDADHHVTIANRAAAEFFGFNDQVVGRALIEAVRHHEIVAVAERLRKESPVLGVDLRLEGPPMHFLQINAVALRDTNGQANGAVMVFHDVTRIRELEGVRQEFVANVSHELRTPLSLIKGASETLIDGAKNDPVGLDRLLNIIDRHADRMTLLIDDLLLLAKLDSGRVVLNLQSLPLRLSVQEVVEDLAPRALVREMTLLNQLPSGLMAQADADRLRQVLWNLIDNAIKYGRPAGTVRISARTLDEKFIEVAVQDDGPGIPADARARVFERFYRADKARSREQGGTGLGLAIVKHVVQAHGGEVRVESLLGQGAAFYFTLLR